MYGDVRELVKEVEIKLRKSKMFAYVRHKDQDEESITFEIRFSEPILESVLERLARGEFGSGFTTSERYFTIRLVGLTHHECCERLDAFLKEFDEKLSEVVLPWTMALQKRFGK